MRAARVVLAALVLLGCGDGSEPPDPAEPIADPAADSGVDPALLHELLGEAVEVQDQRVRVDGLLVRLAFEPLIRETGPVTLQQVQGGGYRLTGIADGSPLWLLGLREGDVLTEVDGNPIAGREHALRSAWQARPRAFELAYLRAGEAQRLRIEVDRSPVWRSQPEPTLDPLRRPPARRPSSTDAAARSLELAEGIRCVEVESGLILARCEITREVLDKLLASPDLLMRQARIVPSMRDGETHGLKLFGIRRGTLVSRVGIKNGDLILDVEGHTLTTPDAALEAYAAVRKRDEITATIERRGQRQQLVFSFVDALSGPPASVREHPDDPKAPSPDLKDPFAAD